MSTVMTAHAADALKVVAFAGASNWPFWVCQQENLFVRENVDVSLDFTPNSVEMAKNLMARRYDLALSAVDNSSYSSLAADTTHSIMKQGILYDTWSATMTPPGTSGYAINYLIQGTFAETDDGSTVLPYYNSSNPAVAWSGPSNSGTAQYTQRSGYLTLSTKAGTAATAGSQTTPAADSGYVPLWVVTVAYGATTITSPSLPSAFR